MTQRTEPRLIILAANEPRAREIAARKNLPRAAWIWPRVARSLGPRLAEVPLYVDRTLWNHPDAHALAEYVAARVVGVERRRARATQLARASSKALN